MDVYTVTMVIFGGMFVTASWAITCRMITAVFGQEKD